MAFHADERKPVERACPTCGGTRETPRTVTRAFSGGENFLPVISCPNREFHADPSERDKLRAELEAIPAKGVCVVVIEGEYVNGRVYPDVNFGDYVALGRRLPKGFSDKDRVRVIVEKVESK